MGMQRKAKFSLWVFVVLVVLATVWAFLPDPMRVETRKVRQGLFEQSIDDDGKTRVRERYVISAPLAGRVARITLDAGDAVSAGQSVATLLPTAPALLDARTVRELRERLGAAQATHAQAKAEEARAQAALVQARLDLARQRTLEAEGFLSSAARDQAQLQVRVAVQALAAARSARDGASHNEAQARAALESVRSDGNGHASGQALAVIAPISGRVLRVLQQSEAAVPMGAPLLEVAQTDDWEVVVDVLSTEALRIAPGMAVKLDAGGGVRFEGVVRRVEPGAFTKVSALGVEEQRVNVIIDPQLGAESASAGGDAPVDAAARVLAALGDAYRVDVRILTQTREDALLVPVAALFRQQGDWAVFVVSNGRVQLCSVQLGGRNLTDAWVLDGLQAGDTVVVYPGDLLEDGARVKSVEAGR